MSEKNTPKTVLCAANAYTRQYYLAEAFARLPQAVREELQILCVLYTEEIGGILTLFFDEGGRLRLETAKKENDFFYDDIGSELKIRRLQKEKETLFASLETYYRVREQWKEGE